MLRFEARAVAVELDGTLTRGMTVVDERPRGQPESNNVEVAYHVDADAAMSAILDACS
jgi:inosine-uridine nucleoside N-ribohydrolase